MCYRLRNGFDVNLTAGLKLNFFIKFPHWIVLKIHAEFPMPCSSIPMLFSGSPVSHFLFYLLFFVVPFTFWSSCIGKSRVVTVSKSQECPKTIPSSPNSAQPPSPTFLNERKCHSENWSSSRQRISEHCWVCDLISHIGHAREKPSPLLKISWKPGTCKPRWDFVELWLVILADTIWSQSLSSFFMVTDACVF